jgi:hypothetical protein
MIGKQKLMLLKQRQDSHFHKKVYQIRLAAGLRPDPLGELTPLPQTV